LRYAVIPFGSALARQFVSSFLRHRERTKQNAPGASLPGRSVHGRSAWPTSLEFRSAAQIQGEQVRAVACWPRRVLLVNRVVSLHRFHL